MSLKALTIAGFQSLGTFPDDYDSTKAYPVIPFLPGKGEAGMSGTTGLTVHGPHKWFTSTTTGSPQAIILSISPGTSNGLTVAQTAAIVKDILAQFKVTKIYPTGLSLGAQNWMNFLFQPGQDLSMIGGVLLFSTDTPNVAPWGTDVIDYSIFKKNNMWSYGGVGSNDPFYNGLPNNMLLMFNGVKAQNPAIPPVLDVWPNEGHDGGVWDPGYSPTFKSVGMGTDLYDKVIQLSPATGTVVTPPVTPPATPPVTPPAKTITSVKVTVVTTYSDGSTSTATLP